MVPDAAIPGQQRLFVRHLSLRYAAGAGACHAQTAVRQRLDFLPAGNGASVAVCDVELAPSRGTCAQAALAAD